MVLVTFLGISMQIVYFLILVGFCVSKICVYILVSTVKVGYLQFINTFFIF